MQLLTSDLSDAHPEAQVADPILRHFGGRTRFHGPVRTVKCFEDNTQVRATLQTPGGGAVLVVDGGGSTRCALFGDQLATLAVQNGWSGVVIYGCLRDSGEVATMDVGALALAAHPRKSHRRGEGQVDVAVRFAGVDFRPGFWVYADEDGLLVAHHALHTS